MKKIKFLFHLSTFILLLISCSNHPPKIDFLNEDYFAKYFVIENFNDNEQCIKYIFSFAEKQFGYFEILTDKNIYDFEDGVEFLRKKNKNRFFFHKDKNKYYSIIINILKKRVPIQFQNEQGKEVKPYEPPVIKVSATDYEEEASKINSKTLSLYYNFETLNLNILQNLLDFAEQDKEKKEIDTYIYELYNKDKEKKIVITYHDKGEWFEVEII